MDTNNIFGLIQLAISIGNGTEQTGYTREILEKNVNSPIDETDAYDIFLDLPGLSIRSTEPFDATICLEYFNTHDVLLESNYDSYEAKLDDFNRYFTVYEEKISHHLAGLSLYSNLDDSGIYYDRQPYKFAV